jgi:hypothetical protein
MTVWRLSSRPNHMLRICNICGRDGAADCRPGDACHSRAPPRRQWRRIPHQPVGALLVRQHRPCGHFIAADDFCVVDEGAQGDGRASRTGAQAQSAGPLRCEAETEGREGRCCGGRPPPVGSSEYSNRTAVLAPGGEGYERRRYIEPDGHKRQVVFAGKKGWFRNGSPSIAAISRRRLAAGLSTC